MSNFIHQLRAKPEHVRERIAYGTAAGVTAVIAGVWFATSLTTTGILAPAASPGAVFARNAAAASSDAAQPTATSQGFLGSAVSAFTGNPSPSPAHLQIVNVSQSSTVPGVDATSTERTVIPF
ncbi:MAG: hypothetical protein B7X04_03560 [Parcubacteria group bacterium 21-54-25]|nr:MAG: hypothetical protein B7X04_03560 [Parcubacteria group bacterium 21-54-25]HQU08064.1 hypothetical protein [Candidatus Paceibacterota bacterium]